MKYVALILAWLLAVPAVPLTAAPLCPQVLVVSTVCAQSNQTQTTCNTGTAGPPSTGPIDITGATVGVILIGAQANGANVNSVSDTCGNVWTPVQSLSSTAFTQMFYAYPLTTCTNDVFECDNGAGGNRYVCYMLFYSGVGTLDSGVFGTATSNLSNVGSMTTNLPEFAPTMTSNTAPSPYVVSASNETNPAWEGMDGNAGTAWVGNGGGVAWWKIDLGSAHAIQGYSLTMGGDYFPKTWTFQGSPDNTTWTTLDTETNQTLSSGATTSYYFLGNSTSYRYFKLNITANYNGGTYTAFAEMGLYASIPIVPNQINDLLLSVVRYKPSGGSIVTVDSGFTILTDDAVPFLSVDDAYLTYPSVSPLTVTWTQTLSNTSEMGASIAGFVPLLPGSYPGCPASRQPSRVRIF